MSDVPDRSLTILTDGKVMKGYRRARLRGRDALGLYPMPFTLQIWNLSTSDYLQLCSGRKVTVKSGTSVLASGYVSNVSQRNVDDGLLTEAVFSAGLKLWESQVSVSVGPVRPWPARYRRSCPLPASCGCCLIRARTGASAGGRPSSAGRRNAWSRPWPAPATGPISRIRACALYPLPVCRNQSR